MPLTVVTGRANAGKTGILYDAIRTCVRSGESALLLVPSRPDVARAVSELASDCPLGLRIVDFDSYLEGLWPLLGDGRPVVSRIQRVAILRRIVEETRLDALEASSVRPGFLPALAALVGHAAEHGDLPSRPAAGRGVAAELAALVTAYSERLHALGLIERGEALRRVARTGHTGGASVVAVNRFADLSGPQLDFVVATGSQARAFVALTWEESFPATEAADPLVRVLLESADSHRHVTEEGAAVPPELAALEGHLFGGSALTESGGAVRLSCAGGETAEAERIATEVSRLVTGGAAPERIAVVYRDPSRHRRVLMPALTQLGLDADFDARVPLHDTALGRGTRSLVAFAARGERDDLVAFLHTPWSGLSQDRADELEAEWRGGRVKATPRLLASLRRSDGPAASLAEEAARLGALPVSAETAPRWRGVLAALLRNGLSGDPRRDGLDAAAHRAFMRVVSEMAGLQGERFTVADLEAELADAMVAPAGAETTGRVQVTSVERLRGRRFDAVILGGLTASEFPRPENAGLPASDAAEEAMRLLGITEVKLRDASFERLLFYLAVTRARRTLVLSRQHTDEDGNPLRPSVFWEEVLDLYRPAAEDAPDAGPETVSLAAHESAGLADGSDLPRRHVQQRAVGAGRTGDGCEQMFDTRVLEDLASCEAFSASDLETYLACPFRWFHRRVVKAQGLDAEIGVLESGNLAHRVLHRVYGELPGATGTRRVTPEVLEAAEALAGAVFADELSRVPEPASLEEEEGLRSTLRDVKALLRRDASFLVGFEPLATEWRFGLGDDPPEDLGDFALRGSVDRIDSDGGRLVITDYKRTKASTGREIRETALVQLPLYAAVASRRLGMPVVAMFYRSLRRPADRGLYLADQLSDEALKPNDRVVAEDMETVLHEALELSREAVAGIRAGAVPASPRNPGLCDTCEARHGCGREV